MLKNYLIILAFIDVATSVQAQLCTTPTASHTIYANNIKVTIKNDGTILAPNTFILQNNSSPREIGNIGKMGLWLGGRDQVGNLHCSGAYSGIGKGDYFAGPLNMNGITTTENCTLWDRIWTVRGQNISKHIIEFRKARLSGIPYNCDSIPIDIKSWPAKGNPYFQNIHNWALPDQLLADFWDEDNNGVYDPCKGDYPIIPQNGCLKAFDLDEIPAEISFYIFNDNGGIQQFTGPTSGQLEIHVYTYAYNRADEFDDATFHTFRIINKGNDDKHHFYAGLAIDPNLGCDKDDYWGSDPDNNLTYIYNKTELDNVENTCNQNDSYTSQPPVIGIKLIDAPWVGKTFLKDSLGQYVYDDYGEKVIVDPPPLYNGYDTLVQGNLHTFNGKINTAQIKNFIGSEKLFYNFINTNTFDYEGNPASILDSNTMCYKPPVATEDVIMLMSVGPMLLQPSVNTVFTYAIFGIDRIQQPCPDITKIIYNGHQLSSILENCISHFDNIEGPILNSQENDQEIIIEITNPFSSNNANESYVESDLKTPPSFINNEYKFEGYKLFQLSRPDVTNEQLADTSFARLIAQSDIKNAIDTMYNWVLDHKDPLTKRLIYKKEMQVAGSNEGIENFVTVTVDAFDPQKGRLMNDKNYYFKAIAYAQNNWMQYDSIYDIGQKTTYIQSKYPYNSYSFSPKKSSNGENVSSVITRISGQGNPNIFIDIDDNQREEMLVPNFDGEITYLPNKGPVKIEIFDKDKISIGTKYRLTLTGSFTESLACQYGDDAVWQLSNANTGEILLDHLPLYEPKEYLLKDDGFILKLRNYADPGAQENVRNGGIDAILEYKNPQNQWFNAVQWNGKFGDQTYNEINMTEPNQYDPNESLSKMGNQYFVPFVNARFKINPEIPFYLSPSARELHPILTNIGSPFLKTKDLNNVDIVLTNDKSKWSKCAVVETTTKNYVELGYPSINDAKNFELRKSPSVGKNGELLNDNTNGMSYFPGYAIDVESGDRLNIFFGENSSIGNTLLPYLDQNKAIGQDMIFNPSSQHFAETAAGKIPIFGGQHYIYVTRESYDGCAKIAAKLKQTSSIQRAKAATSITWTSFPVTKSGSELKSIDDGLIPSDVILKLRVDNSYTKTRLFDIDKEKACSHKDDNPVYEFDFLKTSTTKESYLSHIPQLTQTIFTNGEDIQLTFNDKINPSFITIINSLGLQIIQLKSTGPTSSLPINQALSPGVYFIQVKLQNRQRFSLKFVVI